MDALVLVAMAHHGLLTTKMARDVGYDERALGRAVRRGLLEHLARGLYALPMPEASPEQLHLRLARGGLLLYPDAGLGHVSAVLAHGLPVFGPDLRRATLCRPVRREVLTQHFRIRRDSVPMSDTETGRAMAPAFAIVHFALDAGSLSGIVAADHALHSALITHENLAEAAATVEGWPHSGRVRTMLAMADGRSESVGESRLRVHVQAAGINLVPQVRIRDEAGRVVARADFVVEGTKVIVEFDGKVKYTDGGTDALFAEKRREDELRRLGYVLVRVVWVDLDHPERIVAWIKRAVEVAA